MRCCVRLSRVRPRPSVSRGGKRLWNVRQRRPRLARAAFSKADMQPALFVFKLFQTVGGHEVEELFDLFKVHTRHGNRRWRLFVFGSLHGVSEFEKSSGRARKHFNAGRMNRDIILNANSSHAFDVHSGLQGHYTARANLLFLTPADAWGFVNLNPQSMAGAVHEILA